MGTARTSGYEVSFRGIWRGLLAHAFDDLDRREQDGDTVVSVRDQPALMGLLQRASEFGLVVEDVRSVEAREDDEGPDP